MLFSPYCKSLVSSEDPEEHRESCRSKALVFVEDWTLSAANTNDGVRSPPCTGGVRGLCVQSVVTHPTDGTSWLGGRRLEAPIPCHIYQQWFAVLFSFLQPPQKAPLLHLKCKTSAKPSFPRPKPSRNTPNGPHQGLCSLNYSSTTLQTLLDGRGRCQHGIISRSTRSDSHFAFLIFDPSDHSYPDDSP